MICYFSLLDNSELKYIQVECDNPYSAKMYLLKQGFKEVKRVHKKTFEKERSIFLSCKDKDIKG